MVNDVFARIDRNTDHEISRDELVEYLRKGRAKSVDGRVRHLVAGNDVDVVSLVANLVARHGDGDVLTLAQFERVVFESDLTQTLLQTETLRHLLKEGLTCHKLGSNSWVEAASKHATALHWNLDAGELIWLRRDRSQVRLPKDAVDDVLRTPKRPDCISLKLRKGDGPASMRTFSLDPKLRDALFHVLSGLVFPDRETPSTRHIIDDTLDEEVVLRKRPNATPRNFPGRVVPGEGV